MPKRKIILIDEEKCDGCGQCVPNCEESALKIVNGKIRLIKEIYCDGLGACLGHCPRNALSIEEREADPYDETATYRHVAALKAAAALKAGPHAPQEHGHGCPSARMRSFGPRRPAAGGKSAADAPSELTQWPVQLMLIPPQAPFLQGANLLIAADCVPFAMANFHDKLLKGKALLIGCPKLDDAAHYVDKLEAMFRQAGIKSVTIAHMEVPCCFGIERIVQEALSRSGGDIPLYEVTVSVDGSVLEGSAR